METGSKPARLLSRSASGKFVLFLRNKWQLCLMLLIPMGFLLLFSYVPLYGLQIAFKDYNASLGMWGSPWVGLKHFTKFFESYQFERVLRNTVLISLYTLAAGFPIPIILALSLNCCQAEKDVYKRQTGFAYCPSVSSFPLTSGLYQLSLANGS